MPLLYDKLNITFIAAMNSQQSVRSVVALRPQCITAHLQYRIVLSVGFQTEYHGLALLSRPVLATRARGARLALAGARRARLAFAGARGALRGIRGGFRVGAATAA